MDERHAYWLAALVDGEGSIVTRQRIGRRNPQVCLSIAQNDRRLLERAQEYLDCGYIYEGQGPRKLGCQLQVNRRADVVRALTVIAPLLIIKQDKAYAALALLTALD